MLAQHYIDICMSHVLWAIIMSSVTYYTYLLLDHRIWRWPNIDMGGGPRVVVSTAAFHARVRGSVPGLGGLKETKNVSSRSTCERQYCWEPRDREVACSASDRQGSNFEFYVWRTVSSQSSHHPQEVPLAQFSLYVHKGGLKPDSFHFIRYQFMITYQLCRAKPNGSNCLLFKWAVTAFWL